MQNEKVKAFVQEYGTANLMLKLGVSYQAIQTWIGGKNIPRPNRAQEMVRLSKGKLTMLDIYATKEQNERAATADKLSA
jgi:hypothetical protein